MRLLADRLPTEALCSLSSMSELTNRSEALTEDTEPPMPVMLLACRSPAVADKAWVLVL